MLRKALAILAMVFAALVAPSLAIAGEQPAAAAKATVTVKAFYDSTSDPVGSGLTVLVDDKVVGVTASNGQKKVTVTAGKHRFSVYDPSLAGGAAEATVKAGSTSSLNVILTGEGLNDVIDARLVAGFGSVLPATSKTFAFQFKDAAGKKVPLSAVRSAVVTLVNGGSTIDVTDRLTTSSAGDIKLAGGAAIADVLAADGVQRIEIWADSPKGYGLWGTATYVVGRYKVTGTLKAPPSLASLKVGSLKVKVSLLGTSYTRTVKADAKGKFTFTNVPKGNIAFEAETKSAGKVYAVGGSLFVSGNMTIKAYLLGSKDVLNGVVSIVVVSTTAEPPAPSAERAERAAADARLPHRVPVLSTSVQPSAAFTAVSISGITGTKDMPQTAQKQLVVPKGTKKVRLVYEIKSAEYPYYVLKNSIFNDVWSIKVVAPTKVVFDMTNNVNAQVSVPPIWQSDGSTGEIVELIDVSTLTGTGSVALTLFGSATNIGDSAYQTSYAASLGPVDDTFTVSYVGVSSATSGPKDIISVPRPTKKNLYEKLALFDIDSPSTAKVSAITGVEVQHLLGSTATSGTVIYKGAVKKISDKRFGVPITYTRSTKSAVTSTPPYYGRVAYLVKVNAKIASKAVNATSQTAMYVPLWQLPDALSRYGYRDPGGDGWAARGTYNWLVTNAASVTRVDDISGEHGRSIGHATHRRGTDIDIFQFYSLKSTSGLTNYLALEKAARTAVTGTGAARTAAIATLTSAVTAQRTGLTTLAGNSDVVQLFAGQGRKVNGSLPAGWLAKLMKSGTFTGINSAHTVVTIDSGATLSTKIRYNDIHNSHNHITLNVDNMTAP